VIEAVMAEDKQGLSFRMRGELALCTPQPGEEPARTAVQPEPAAAEAKKPAKKKAAPVRKPPKKDKK
jgi:hypothetical protein